MNILHVKSTMRRWFAHRKCSRQHGQRSKSECAALTSSLDRNNSDGKATLKQQKTLETTTETQDASKCY